MFAVGRCWMNLRGLAVAALVLWPLSGGSSEDSSGGGDTQAGSSDTAHLTDANIQMVNDLIAKEMEDKNLPSVVVGVWTADEGEYVTAQGAANLDTGREREPEDPFRIASITKTFTGTAILQLVDEGKLRKSDP